MVYHEQTDAYNLIEPEDLGKGSNIRLERCETEQDMHWNWRR